MTDDHSPFSPAYRWMTVGLVGYVTLIAFETISVATAMPTAVRDLDGLRWYGWAFTGFMIANVVGMVLSGLWSDRLGPRRSLLGGLGFFTAGLIASGTANTMLQFVGGRVSQGLGAGLAVVGLYVAIGDIYPDRLRPRVFALISAAWVLPALIGPFIAGALAEHGSWRLVFLGLLPVLALLSGAIWQVVSRSRVVTNPPPASYGRLGYGVAAGVGLALVQAGLEQLGEGRRLLAVASVLGGIALLTIALRSLWPAGTTRLRQGIPAAVMSRGLIAGAFFGMESLLPLTLSEVHGFSATLSGLPLLVGAVAWSTGSAIQGRSTVPRWKLVRIGGSFVAAAALALPLIVWVPGGAWLAYPIWLVAGAGMGLALSSISVLLLDLSPVGDRGRDSSAMQLSEAVTNSLTIGIGGALVAASVAGVLSFRSAVTVHDLLLAVLGLVVAFGAVRLTAPHPAESTEGAR